MRGFAPTQHIHHSAHLIHLGLLSLYKSVPWTVPGHWNWSVCTATLLKESSEKSHPGTPLPSNSQSQLRSCPRPGTFHNRACIWPSSFGNKGHYWLSCQLTGLLINWLISQFLHGLNVSSFYFEELVMAPSRCSMLGMVERTSSLPQGVTCAGIISFIV